MTVHADLPPYLNAIKKSIEDGYKYPLNEEKLARQAGVSLSKLQHGFKSFYCSSLKDFQVSIRIRVAKELLRCNRQYSIKRIAIEVGYKSGESFANVFKKITGVTPSHFRDNAM
jgi:two-component system response regulator YesN